MIVRRLVMASATCLFLIVQPVSLAQELSCADIEWAFVVTREIPNVAAACDAVVEKNGKRFARIEVEIQRVRGNTLTFKIINNDGSSGGTFVQSVGDNWRAKLSGEMYRARDLIRGQRLNVYLPGDRWAAIAEDDDGPDEADAVNIMTTPGIP